MQEVEDKIFCFCLPVFSKAVLSTHTDSDCKETYFKNNSNLNNGEREKKIKNKK